MGRPALTSTSPMSASVCQATWEDTVKPVMANYSNLFGWILTSSFFADINECASKATPVWLEFARIY